MVSLTVNIFKCGDVVCATLPFLQCLLDEVLMQRVRNAENLHNIFKTESSGQQNSSIRKYNQTTACQSFQIIQRKQIVMLCLLETSDVLIYATATILHTLQKKSLKNKTNIRVMYVNNLGLQSSSKVRENRLRSLIKTLLTRYSLVVTSVTIRLKSIQIFILNIKFSI